VRVQLNRALVPTTLAAGLALVAAWPCAAQESASEPDGTTLMRWFVDSDHVAVRSLVGDYTLPLRPGLGLTVHWNNERVVVPGVEAPAGSQEAVDAITTASRPIAGNAYQDFVKVRNEFEGTLTRGTASLDYYHSKESDYLGQQLGAHWDRDLMDRQLNLALGASYGWDAIEPLADDDTRGGAATKTTLHWNATATRLLSPTTMVRVGAELNLVDGLQHNPYRNVYAGGTHVAERHPDHRQRRDLFLKLNRWFENRSSMRLGYRYYADDWGIDSHETSAKLSQYVTPGVAAAYEYRWYTQTAADFFRDEYATVDGIGGYRSGDYRMDALSSHLFGFSLNLDLGTLAPGTRALRHLGVWVDVERYFNSNNYSANIVETGLDLRF
jgi:hypothetical protein